MKKLKLFLKLLREKKWVRIVVEIIKTIIIPLLVSMAANLLTNWLFYVKKPFLANRNRFATQPPGECRSASHAASRLCGIGIRPVVTTEPSKRTWLLLAARVLENDAPDVAALERRSAEVDGEAKRQIHEFHVGQRLHLEKHGVRLLHGFRLDDQAVVDQKVDSEVFFEAKTHVFDWNRNFPDRSVSLHPQSLLQAFDIDALQQTRSEMFVDSDRGVDHDFGQCIGLLIQRVHGAPFSKRTAVVP